MIIKCFHVSSNVQANINYCTLFLTDKWLVIACKPSFPPYLAALNPTDQVFDFEELEYHYQVANRTEDVPTTTKIGGGDVDEDDDDVDDMKPDKLDKDEGAEEISMQDSALTTLPQIETPSIDNPYLRAAKIPKRIKNETSLIV